MSSENSIPSNTDPIQNGLGVVGNDVDLPPEPSISTNDSELLNVNNMSASERDDMIINLLHSIRMKLLSNKNPLETAVSLMKMQINRFDNIADKIEELARVITTRNNSIVTNGVVTNPTASTESHQSNKDIAENNQENNVISAVVAIEEVNESQPTAEDIEIDWLKVVEPIRTPYYPQLKDKLVYFMEGHERYLKVVKRNKIYNLDEEDEPWNYLEIKKQEFVQVKDIKYKKVQGNWISYLELERLNVNEKPTNVVFRLKFMDIIGVVDFLILKQYYDIGVRRIWQEGDKFRCLLDNQQWHFGKILSINQTNNSEFEKYKIKWNDEGIQKLSCWEMEPIDDANSSSSEEVSALALEEEKQALMYQAGSEDFPIKTKEETINIILLGFERVMKLEEAKRLADGQLDESNSRVPFDINTIKNRLEKGFYRRIDSLEHELKQLEKILPEKYSIIIRILLKVIADPNEHDVAGTYEELKSQFGENESQCSELYLPDSESQSLTQNSIIYRPSTSTSASTSRSRFNWHNLCRKLLKRLKKNKDCRPFVSIPTKIKRRAKGNITMTLNDVEEQLEADLYRNPIRLYSDLNLICREYKTICSKRTKPYKNIPKFKDLYDSEMKDIIADYKLDEKESGRNSNGPSTCKRKFTATEETDDSEDEDANEFMNKKRKTTPVKENKKKSPRKRIIIDEDDDDENYSVNEETSKSQKTKNKIRSSCKSDRRSKRRLQYDDTDSDNSESSDGNDESESSDNESNDSEEEIDDFSDYDDNDGSSDEESDDYSIYEDSDVDYVVKSHNTRSMVEREKIEKYLAFCTKKDELESFKLDSSVKVKGIVTYLSIDYPLVKNTRKKLKLLSFFLQNDEGCSFHCKAFNNAATQFEDIIRNNDFISMERAVIKKSRYNYGNMKYEIHIKPWTTVVMGEEGL